MSRTARLAALGAASAAAVAMTAAPAQAAQLATGTISVKVNGGNPVATCSSTLSGTRTGSAINVTSATATGCGAPVSPTSLPWTGNIAAPATMGFAVSALGCTYSGTLTGGTVSGSTVTWANKPVSGSGLFCISGVTVTAVYTFS